MSKTDNLQLEIPSAADKHIFTTYKNNNEIIDEAYGQYLEDQETSQENIAMIESSTAQSNHAVGSYFMLDNVLHKATSAIASGETIASGSNATPITIEEALTALNTSVSSLRDSVYHSNGTISTTAIRAATDSAEYILQFDARVEELILFKRTEADPVWRPMSALYNDKKVVYEKYTVVCNSTSAATSWEKVVTKENYHPIGVTVSHSHSTGWHAGAEGITRSLGYLYCGGFYDSTGGLDHYIIIDAVWVHK